MTLQIWNVQGWIFFVLREKENTTLSKLALFKEGDSSSMKPSKIQLTLVISNSLISNNRLSRSDNLALAQTWKSNNM